MAGELLFARLYLDESVYPDLANAIRQRGFDCTSAVEVNMLTKRDNEQLTYAAAQGRCVLSFNVRDFRRLSLEWSRDRRDHAGIIVTNHVGREAFGQLLSRVLHVLDTYTADEMQNVYLHI